MTVYVNLYFHYSGDGLVYLLTGVVPLLALAPEQRKLSSLMLHIKRQLSKNIDFYITD